MPPAAHSAAATHPTTTAFPAAISHIVAAHRYRCRHPLAMAVLAPRLPPPIVSRAVRPSLSPMPMPHAVVPRTVVDAALFSAGYHPLRARKPPPALVPTTRAEVPLIHVAVQFGLLASRLHPAAPLARIHCAVAERAVAHTLAHPIGKLPLVPVAVGADLRAEAMAERLEDLRLRK